MSRTPKDFVNELGGYRAVAVRFGVSDKTIHSHYSAKRLPPRWYVAFCDLAREQKIMAPSPDLFDFKPLPEIEVVSQEGAA